MMRKLLVLLLMVAAASATIQLVTPRHVSLESLDTVVISPVGPGHDIFLKFQRKVGDYVWDSVRLINTIDTDWELSTYSDYQYIYYVIHVPPEKPSGRYTFQFEVRDNEGLKGPEIAVVQVVVTHNQDELIAVSQMPPKADGFAAETFSVPFDIRNKALSRVSYQVTSWVRELPSLGKKTLSHSFLSGETKSINVPVNVPEEGHYTLVAHVWSEDNPTIDKTVTTKLLVRPTFRSKLRSIGQGFPLVPLTMAPFYALLGVFGW